MYQIDAEIISNLKLTADHYKLTLLSKKISEKAKPGEFVNIRISDGLNPFLRRPFSIAGVIKNKIEVIYKVKGSGTEILSKKKRGEKLNIIGPMGNGFNLNLPSRSIRPNRSTRSPILIAGGTGVASLLFLAQSHLKRCRVGLPDDYKHNLQPIVFIGARRKEEILCVRNFKKLGCKVKIATDDGSLGFKGTVVDLFKNIIYRLPSTIYPVVFACGPYKMLKGIANICKEHKIPSQVALEERMACGVGVCMGCVVKTRINADRRKTLRVGLSDRVGLPETNADNFEYKRVCKDGPVFDGQEIIW